MKRVLHLRSSAGIAGPERQIVELARRLPDCGFEVEVALLFRRPAGAAPTVSHPLLQELAREGIAAWQIDDPERAGISAAATLARRLESGGIDIVHTHDPKANWVSRAARRGGPPRVATIHLHTRSTAVLRLHALFDRRYLTRFDRLIDVGGTAGAGLRDRTGGAPRRIANGIDRESLLERIRRDRSADDSPAAKEWLLAAGRLTRQKGFDILLEALPEVVARRPELRLTVAGDGPERRSLEAQSRALGLDRFVTWVGERGDLPSLFAGVAAFVLPSRDEGSPYALLEAMALGAPVVASAVGGVPELLEGGAAGRLVPPRDARALADAIVETLERPDERRLRAERACELVLTRWSAERMARDTAAVYSELAA